MFVLTVVDVAANKLLNEWIVVASIDPAKVDKTFIVHLEINCTETKVPLFIYLK